LLRVVTRHTGGIAAIVGFRRGREFLLVPKLPLGMRYEKL
jgi:hypothetical protein